MRFGGSEWGQRWRQESSERLIHTRPVPGLDGLEGYDCPPLTPPWAWLPQGYWPCHVVAQDFKHVFQWTRQKLHYLLSSGLEVIWCYFCILEVEVGLGPTQIQAEGTETHLLVKGVSRSHWRKAYEMGDVLFWKCNLPRELWWQSLEIQALRAYASAAPHAHLPRKKGLLLTESS